MVDYYADQEAVEIELNEFGVNGSGVLTENLIARGMLRANQIINSKLIDITIPLVIPDEIVEAATLYSVSRILDILYTDQDGRSPTAVQNDKDADAILQGYIDENPTEGVNEDFNASATCIYNS